MTDFLIESFSGIRGVYGKGITEALARKYAFCYFDLFKGKIESLIIAGDTRKSTPSLKRAFSEQFSGLGVKLIDIGTVPVQTAELAVQELKADGGVYVSASHNEPEFNGWKLLKKDGAILNAAQAEELIERARNLDVFKEEKGKAEVMKKDVVDLYVNFVLEKLGKGVEKIRDSHFKVLIDANGGAVIPVLKKLLKELNVDYEMTGSEPGVFKRKIEPNQETLSFLSGKVSKGFQFGCGFDCDGDRVEFVLPSGSDFVKQRGQMVSGQYILALACDAVLEGTQGEIVPVNDATSYLVRDVIKKHGAVLEEVEVGETNVVEKMEEKNSLIGGEGSNGGVIVFPIKCRDGIMTLSLILKMSAEKGKSLTEILENYPRYYYKLVNVKCSPEKVFEVKRKIEEHFKDKEIKKTGDETGGLKIMFDKNSFLWFRQSKTEPGAFRIIADADDKEKEQNILKKGLELFKKYAN